MKKKISVLLLGGGIGRRRPVYENARGGAGAG